MKYTALFLLALAGIAVADPIPVSEKPQPFVVRLADVTIPAAQVPAFFALFDLSAVADQIEGKQLSYARLVGQRDGSIKLEGATFAPTPTPTPTPTPAP